MKRNTSNWSNFCMLSRRVGLTASAGLSCLYCNHSIAIVKSSLGSCDECILGAKHLPSLRLSKLTLPVNLPVGCYRPHPLSSFIIMKANTHFTVSQREEGKLTQLACTHIAKRYIRLHTVTHTSTNWAWNTITTLNELNVLALIHSTMPRLYTKVYLCTKSEAIHFNDICGCQNL